MEGTNGLECVQDPGDMVRDLLAQQVSVSDAVNLVNQFLRLKNQIVAVRLQQENSVGDSEATSLSITTRSSRRRQRRLDYLAECGAVSEREGFCYLKMVKLPMRLSVRDKIGAYPNLFGIWDIPPEAFDLEAMETLDFRESRDRYYHVELNSQGGSLLLMRRTLRMYRDYNTPLRSLFGEEKDLKGDIICADFKFGAIDTFDTPFIGCNIATVSATLDMAFMADVALPNEMDFRVASQSWLGYNEAIVEKQVDIDDTKLMRVDVGKWYRVASQGDIAIRFRDCDVIFADGRKYSSDGDDVLAWTGTTSRELPFRVYSHGASFVHVIAYVLPKTSLNNEYADYLKRRLRDVISGILSQSDKAFSMPVDIARIFDVATVSVVADSVATVAQRRVEFSGLVLVKSRVHVALARNEYPNAVVRYLGNAVGTHYDNVVFRSYPQTIHGLKQWYRGYAGDVDNWMLPRGIRTYADWSDAEFALLLTRHTHSLVFHGLDYDVQLVTYLRGKLNLDREVDMFD